MSIVKVEMCEMVWPFDHVRSDAANLTDAWDLHAADIGNGSAR